MPSPGKTPSNLDKPPAPRFESRWATVLFADVSGFTRLGEGMAAADLMKLTNRCLDLIQEEVVRFGGYPIKRVGDCLMATFGAPAALENAPHAAVNAAIEMRTRVLRFARDEGLALNIHTGVNTGQVAVGIYGGIFDAFGNTVNLASRVEGAAPSGAIYVGPATYRATRGEFQYRPTKPLELKNVKKPVRAFEVLSRHEQAHRRVREGDEVRSSLVGREREVTHLREALGALATGRGRIATILGEAGIGKSRLVGEMLALEDAKQASRLEARSLAIGQHLAFHPFQDLLKRWAEITAEDEEAAAHRKLESAVAALLPAAVDDVFPFVARLMNVRLSGSHAERLAGIEGEALEALMFKSVRDLLLALARARPLVLVFEDLHWADESSAKLLHALLPLVMDAPIFLVLVARRDQLHNARRVVDAARKDFAARLTEVQLEPLSARQCHELLENLVPIYDLSQTVRFLICERSGGNPFYLEEVVRSLIEDDSKGLQNVERLEDAVRAVPGTLQEIIMSRIERLPSSAQDLVQVAAVLGRSFPYRVIQSVTRRDANQLESDLRRLVHQQLIKQQMVHGESEYVFIHALVQETIYEGTAKEARLPLHGKVADTIETLFDERISDYYGMLAYHYTRAENLTKAEDYLFKAGTEAARSAAPSEALQFFREASRIYLLLHRDGGDPQRNALLEKNIGLALLHKGNLIESIDHFNRSLELLGERVPRRAIALRARFGTDLAVLLVRLYLNRLSGRGRPNDREVLEVRHNRARAQTTTDARRWVFDTIGSVRRLSETDPRAIEHACGMYAGAAALFAFSGISFAISRRLLTVAERLIRPGNTRDLIVYRTMRYVLHYLEGTWGDEIAIDDDLVDQGMRHGEVWDVSTYLDLNSARKIRQGRWADAEDLLLKLKGLAAIYGFATATEQGRRAFILLEQRKLDDARHAIDVYDAGRYEETLNLWALGIRAKVLTLLGNEDAAASTLAKGCEMVAQSRQVPAYHLSAYFASRLLLDVTRVESLLGSGNHAAARTAARRARTSMRRAVRIAAKVATVRPEIHRLAGRLCWLLGKPRPAMRSWMRSIDEAESLDAKPELARTYLEVGQRMSSVGGDGAAMNDLSAAVCLERAHALFTELGLDWDRAQLEAGRSR